MNDPHEFKREQEQRTEKDAQRLKVRTSALLVLFSAVLVVFAAILFQIQAAYAGAPLPVTVHRVTEEREAVDSVRGEILDSRGRPLVTNTVSYHVELDPQAMGERRNEILAGLLALCREEGVDWAEALPISRTAPWTYTGDAPLRYESGQEGETELRATNLGLLAEKCGWVESALADPPPAEELLAAMCTDFGLIDEDEAPDAEDREMAGVLFALYLRQRQVVYYDYIFARGVDVTFITKARERGLDGVRFVLDAGRQYETDYAAHLLGRTGAIPRGQEDAYKKLGYAGDAVVGLEGVEKAFESWLRGTGGVMLTKRDDTGALLSRSWEDGVEPAAGSNVMLTLDMTLQAAVEDQLARYAETLTEKGGLAAVVVDMTGGVLAMASYPTYDLSTYLEDYSSLAADTVGRPLVNRATMGLYAPGSTFKMVTATAALAEGIITPRDTVRCTGIYTYYPDVHPVCWIWTNVRGTHGTETVTEAIKDSCNIFFYDVGRRLGITKLVEYASAFGLGQPTGIEIPEYQGYVAGPETSAKLGITWYPGNIMNASIGQDNNQFTPLQLANYTATLANGGKRYQVHLLKSVKSADYSETLFEYQPVLLGTVSADASVLDVVKQGMYDLAKTSSMDRYFSVLPVDVGCKTGTAEVRLSTANATFVCFAPFDDPQVAICLVAEKGASGGSLAEVAAAILQQYFETRGLEDTVQPEKALVR